MVYPGFCCMGEKHTVSFPIKIIHMVWWRGEIMLKYSPEKMRRVYESV